MKKNIIQKVVLCVLIISFLYISLFGCNSINNISLTEETIEDTLKDGVESNIETTTYALSKNDKEVTVEESTTPLIIHGIAEIRYIQSDYAYNEKAKMYIIFTSNDGYTWNDYIHRFVTDDEIINIKKGLDFSKEQYYIKIGGKQIVDLQETIQLAKINGIDANKLYQWYEQGYINCSIVDINGHECSIAGKISINSDLIMIYPQKQINTNSYNKNTILLYCDEIIDSRNNEERVIKNDESFVCMF